MSGPGLGSRPTFRHGVHPDDAKAATNSVPIERMPFVDEYVLPLSQHIGAPSKCLVRAGDYVERGHLIAKPGGYVSTALHAPVSGTVKAVELRPHPNGKMMQSIIIETDSYASQKLAVAAPPAPNTLSPEDFTQRVQEAGIVGLGGAAFPSHVKLKVPEGKRAEFLILNGCECEPFLTCDHRVMAERPAAVLEGLGIMQRQVGASRAYIGVEANKMDAIEELRAAAGEGSDIVIVPLEVKYPQGAEKMLIEAIFHKEVPSGGIPIDIEIVVHNVGTAAALADLFATGQPLIERVVTITGDGIRRPSNMLVPIGTPLEAVLDYCGGLKPETRQLIVGGPMMGLAQKRLDVPILKSTSGIVALTRRGPGPASEQPCIRCGRCVEACPMFLNPSRLATLARADEPELLERHHQLTCFECASCSFVCPSHIPLVQLMRMGKALVRENKAKT